jgi:hypothetical protein
MQYGVYSLKQFQVQMESNLLFYSRVINSKVLIKKTRSKRKIKTITIFYKNPNPLNYSFIC